MESHLDDFCRICDADEVVLFERATFLVISQGHAQKGYSSTNTSNQRKISDTTIDGTSKASPSSETEDALSPQDDNTATIVPSTQEGAITTTTTATTSINSPPISTNHRQLTRSTAKSPQFDAHRFEKISNIVKQFKLSCGKTQSQFSAMEVRNSKYSAFIDAFTANTYIMVIVSDPSIHTATTLLNIKNAKSHFERFIPRS